MQYFDDRALKRLKQDARRAPAGFRYGFVKGIFRPEVYSEISGTFPNVSTFSLKEIDADQAGGGRKCFFAGPMYFSGTDFGATRKLSALSDIWRGILKESVSEEFMSLLHEATGVAFNSLCHFGFAYGKEGSVQDSHIDGAALKKKAVSASVACLLYLNRHPGGVSGTRIYDTDRKTILFEVPDLQNSLSFFEQHPDSWHGFPEVPAGADRRILSLSYSEEDKPINLIGSPLYSKLPIRAKRLVQRFI